MQVKISDLPIGMIIWKGNTVLGITGMTLPSEYYDCFCVKLLGNDVDYELVQINVSKCE